jgi:hypothetical protein
MALFKILRGKSQTLPATKTDGWAYFCTDDGGFYIDYTDDKGVLNRKYINQNLWEALGLTLQTIESNIDTIEIDINNIKEEMTPLTDEEIDNLWADTPGTGETPSFSMTSGFVPVWNGATFENGVALNDIATETETNKIVNDKINNFNTNIVMPGTINFGYNAYAAGSKVILKRNGYYMCYCDNSKLQIVEPGTESEPGETVAINNARQIVLMAAPYVTKPEAITYRGCGLAWYSGTSAFTANVDGFRTSLKEGSYITANEEFYICQMTKGDLAALKTNPTKVLFIGNSHAQDIFAPLAEVFYAEGQTDFTLGLCMKNGASAQQHADNIANNSASYAYYESIPNQSGSFSRPLTSSTVTIDQVLQQHSWDYVFIQSVPLDLIDDTIVSSARKQITDHITNMLPNANIGYSCAWIAPYSDDKSTLESLTGTVKEWHDAYVAKGCETAADYYTVITNSVTKNLLTDKTYSMVIDCCTPIYYLNQILTINSNSLYRDTLHLKPAGRVFAAYAFYAQFMKALGKLDTLDSVNLEKYVLEGLSLTAAGKKNLLESVNYTLQNPWVLPTERMNQNN